MKIPQFLLLFFSLYTLNADSEKRCPHTQKDNHHYRGLHGYIGYSVHRSPAMSKFNMGMSFYSAVWSLVKNPIADFQIGLASSWIIPDNSDNKSIALAPPGTRARKWPERGPTWNSVFQTLEGGLGYWRGNRFRYGPPKFSMNATPQCYDYEIGSPGWSFFYQTDSLPDNRLGIAQLSNRLLIPPDALPFSGNPNGKFLGYAYMALPLTKSHNGDPPTGDQSWTCFLNAENFKGPIAYYIPETWSKIGKLFNYPFIYGRGLDSRPGVMHGGAMEINTVPCFESRDNKNQLYSKIPQLHFPVNSDGVSILVQDVIYYSKSALYHSFEKWRDEGIPSDGRFRKNGSWKASLRTTNTQYKQGGYSIKKIESYFDNKVYSNTIWGLQWNKKQKDNWGLFPQYFNHVGNKRIPIDPKDVPEETGLIAQKFRLAKRGAPFESNSTKAWTEPGPASGPHTVTLIDGSRVTYSWYKFIDQPSFQQYRWSLDKKQKLQALVEALHANWKIDLTYMSPPSVGKLASLDPALLVKPPKNMKIGYVPIVTEQEDTLTKKKSAP